MKDEERREKGKYTIKYSKNIDNKMYEITETTIIGRDFEILNFVREYNPPLIYKHPQPSGEAIGLEP